MLVVRMLVIRMLVAEIRVTSYESREAAIPTAKQLAPEVRFARGIVAEPPKRKPLAAQREGDGADSPTRAAQRAAKRLAQRQK
jgi:hypothetical protein